MCFQHIIKEFTHSIPRTHPSPLWATLGGLALYLRRSPIIFAGLDFKRFFFSFYSCDRFWRSSLLQQKALFCKWCSSTSLFAPLLFITLTSFQISYLLVYHFLLSFVPNVILDFVQTLLGQLTHYCYLFSSVLRFSSGLSSLLLAKLLQFIWVSHLTLFSFLQFFGVIFIWICTFSDFFLYSSFFLLTDLTFCLFFIAYNLFFSVSQISMFFIFLLHLWLWTSFLIPFPLGFQDISKLYVLVIIVSCFLIQVCSSFLFCIS